MQPPPPFPAPLRGALFDLDGTLADTEPLHHESAVRVLAARGRDVRHEDFRGYIGWAELPFWTELKERYALPGRPEELVEARTAAYLELIHDRSIEPLPGIPELLAELARRGVPCAIASSAPRPQIDASLRATGLEEHFPLRFSGHDDVARGKPAPDVYLAAAAALGVAPTACLAVEDSATGSAAAMASGAFTVLIPGRGVTGPLPETRHLLLEDAGALASQLRATEA